MYTISYLTKRPCGDGRFNEITQVNPNLPRIYQIHLPENAFQWYQKKLDRENDYLILIIRDYKEQLLRATSDDYLQVLNILKSPKGTWGLQIFEDLEEFEQWNPEHRLLIYYEELIAHPEPVCRDILTLLDASDIYLNEFIDNFEFHFDAPLQYYHQTHGGSFSKGKDFHYHTSLLPKGIDEAMDAIVIENYPLLTEKYLKRYIQKK